MDFLNIDAYIVKATYLISVMSMDLWVSEFAWERDSSLENHHEATGINSMPPKASKSSSHLSALS